MTDSEARGAFADPGPRGVGPGFSSGAPRGGPRPRGAKSSGEAPSLVVQSIHTSDLGPRSEVRETSDSEEVARLRSCGLVTRDPEEFMTLLVLYGTAALEMPA